jgi:hydrogenase-4 component E
VNVDLAFLFRFLSSIMVITSVAIIELRDLRRSAYAYMLQSAILSADFSLIAMMTSEWHMYLWTVSSLVTKVLLVPKVLIWATEKTGERIEVKPVLPLTVSFGFEGAIIISLFLVAPFVFPSAESRFPSSIPISLVLFMIGIFGMLSRKCALKQVLCLCHMENGVHLFLASLAYRSPMTVEIGILTDAIAAVVILLYMAIQLKRVVGTLDTFKLSLLRW